MHMSLCEWQRQKSQHGSALYDIDGEPHLYLFARKPNEEGEELHFNYGPGQYSWRTKVFIIFHILY